MHHPYPACPDLPGAGIERKVLSVSDTAKMSHSVPLLHLAQQRKTDTTGFITTVKLHTPKQMLVVFLCAIVLNTAVILAL